jgi:hypothetical protein
VTNEVEVEVNLRPTVSRPVCLGVRRPSGTCDQFFFRHEISFRQLLLCYFVAPSLTRGRVCNLLLVLLGLAREVTLDPKSRRTHGLSHLRLPQPGVGVLLEADSQSASKSRYRASLWDPWPDFILLSFLRVTITFFFFRSRLLWRENGSVFYSAITH